MEEIDLIDLTEATPNQIAKWVRQFKLPDRLVDLFDSGKLKAPYFFIDNKAAEKARNDRIKRPQVHPSRDRSDQQQHSRKQRQIRVRRGAGGHDRRAGAEEI